MAQLGFCSCRKKIRGSNCPCVRNKRNCREYCTCYHRERFEYEEKEEEEQEHLMDNVQNLSYINKKIVIGTQNAQAFGDFATLGRDQLFQSQVDSITQSVEKYDIDCFFIQESTSDKGPKAVVDKLNSNENGQKYDCSTVLIGKGLSLAAENFKGPEHAAVIYKIDKLPEYNSLSPPKLNTLNKALIKSHRYLYGCVFKNRYPAWFVFNNLIIVSVHIISNSSKQALYTIGEIKSLSILFDYLKIEYGVDKEIVFLGDFNLNSTKDAFTGLRERGYEALVPDGRTNKGKVAYTYDNILISQKFKQNNDIYVQVIEQVNKLLDHHSVVMEVAPIKENTATFRSEPLPKSVLDSYISEGIKLNFEFYFV